MKQNYEIIAVDIQNEFATKSGKFYSPKPSIKFLKTELFPLLVQEDIKINEIISDYRQPRPGDKGDGCHPGTWGYESIIPKNLVKSQWIKCMNSPVWVRKNIGIKGKKPGPPYQDPKLFDRWLKRNIGKPSKTIPILIGLTIDCCVLSTLQELSWRGYCPLVLKEGVDHASGKAKDKEQILTSPIPNWSEVINWEKFKNLLTE